MASAFTHAAAALALGTAFRRPGHPTRFWVAGSLCAAVPDLDAVGFRLGIPYGHVLGHRGLSHSLTGAAVLASLAIVAAVRGSDWTRQRGRLWLYPWRAADSRVATDSFGAEPM